LPKSLQKPTNKNNYLAGKTGNNFNRLHTADTQSPRNPTQMIVQKPNALMSFLADILGETTDTKPVNKLPR